MQIHGFNKTTLLDYPGRVAATIFMGGCNFRCPFCQNGDLALYPERQAVISKEEIFAFLKKRKGLLTGVCITGGEPTLSKDLEEIIGEIKDIGYQIKLDTNGYRPEVIAKLLEKQLLDYIAMDMKNSSEKYRETAGISFLDIGKIRESIHTIMESGICYEFRTTMVKEFHKKEDMRLIGEEIRGAEAYFLQGYQESERVIMSGLHSYTKKEMEELAEEIAPYVKRAEIRGIR